MKYSHESVLLAEALEGLNIKPDGVYVDGTLGGGGHSFRIVQKLEGGLLIGIDRDAEAISESTRRLAIFEERVKLFRDNFVNIPKILESLGIDGADGILLDVGVSSYQVDSPERGFSYSHDAPLDMRMDRSAALSAADVVNTYPREDLAKIIRRFGEEDFAPAIARRIEEERKQRKIATTSQLVKIIEEAVPAKVRKGGKGAVKRTFQALRIEVNGELSALEEALPELIGALRPGGRLAVITFHSLEDRIVKEAFKKAENPCTCPPNFPVCVCGATAEGRIITKKPIIPTEEECAKNKRAKSAKLRIFEKNRL